ncbi:sensor histidine kinase [Lysobacter olei]
MSRADLRFALLNLLPAALYAAFIVAGFASMGGPVDVAWWLGLSLGMGLWLATGVLRTLALRRNWFALGAGALLLRFAAVVLPGAVIVQFGARLAVQAATALGLLQSLPGDDYGIRELIAYSIQVALILWLWVAGWAGWHLLRHRRQSEIARLRAESQHSALELDALRARLNPHFVFNALNNVRALINEEPAQAREVVTRLSNILRHALEHSQRDSASLGEELTVVEDYLAVEGVHYEERLRVHRDIATEARDARLPPMLLQLLVENAIKHGIARTPGGGELGMSAWCDDGRLVIEVSNPGRVDQSAGGHGVGLAYLRARLARTPGDRFELVQNGARVLARLEIGQ